MYGRCKIWVCAPERCRIRRKSSIFARYHLTYEINMWGRNRTQDASQTETEKRRPQSDVLAENLDFCPCRGSRRNIAIRFGTLRKKLEWFSYPKVKKFRECVYSFRYNTRTWRTNGRTDSHRMTAQAALVPWLGCNRAAKNCLFIAKHITNVPTGKKQKENKSNINTKRNTMENKQCTKNHQTS